MPSHSQQQESPRRTKLKLEIAKKNERFVVQDDSGVEYGPSAKDRKGAEEILKDWKAYYAE